MIFGLSKIDFITVILLNILWGSSFAISGYSFKYFSPLFLYSIRFLIAGAISILIFPIRNRKNMLNLFFIGIFQAITFIGIALGTKYLNSSTTSILTRLDIFFTIIFGVAIYKEEINWQLCAGLVVCLFAILMLNRDIDVSNFGWFVFCILTTICGALVNIMTKTIKKETQLSVVAYSSLVCGIFIFIIACFVETEFVKPFGHVVFGNIAEYKIDFIKIALTILYLGIFASFYSYVILFKLLKNNPGGKIMPYNFLRPVIGIIAGFLLLGEEITTNKIIAVVLVMAGIVLSQSGMSKKDYEKIDEIESKTNE